MEAKSKALLVVVLGCCGRNYASQPGNVQRWEACLPTCAACCCVTQGSVSETNFHLKHCPQALQQPDDHARSPQQTDQRNYGPNSLQRDGDAAATATAAVEQQRLLYQLLEGQKVCDSAGCAVDFRLQKKSSLSDAIDPILS